jgi:hypothetical protein
MDDSGIDLKRLQVNTEQEIDKFVVEEKDQEEEVLVVVVEHLDLFH